MRPAVASISTWPPTAIVNCGMRYAKRLDVIVEDLLERQRAIAFAGLALAARPEDEAANAFEHPGELQRRHHPIDAVDVLADVFEEQDRAVPIGQIHRAHDCGEHREVAAKYAAARHAGCDRLTASRSNRMRRTQPTENSSHRPMPFGP